MNNPLLYTDPSGYWSFRSFFKSVINIFAPIIAVLPPQISSIIIGVVSTFCGPYAYLCNGAGQAALAYYHGASASEAIRSGIKAGAQAYLFQMAGEVPGADSSARYLAHAAAGCGGAIISGGGSSGCARGAASAVLGKWVTNNTSGSDWNTFTRGVAAAVSGGVTSQMMGGSFANGATTAAYGYLFNHVSSHFDRKSGYLAVVDNDSGKTIVSRFFSGTGLGDQIQSGDYAILQRGDKDGFRLEAYDATFGDDKNDESGQSLLRLHGPGRSNGCITACDASGWTQIKALISSTAISQIEVTRYISVTLPGGYLLGRIPVGTELVKYYGRLKVQ